MLGEREMKKKVKAEYVTVCPHCGSTKVHPDLSKDMVAWGGSTRMLCGDCNFSSIVFPEMPKMDLPKFKKKIKNRTSQEEKEMTQISRTKGFTYKPFTKLYLMLYTLSFSFVLVFIFGEAIFKDNFGMVVAAMSFFFLIAFLVLVVKGIMKK